MRITTITNWAYSATVILTVLAGTAFILSARSAGQERDAVNQHLALNELGEDLELGAEKRTDEARLYIMRGDERHLAAFYVDESEERRFESTVGQAQKIGASADEVRLLNDIVDQAETLDRIETAAIDAYRKGDRAGAQQAIFGNEHYQLHTALLSSVKNFRELTASRTGRDLESATTRSDFFGYLARVMLALTAAVFLAVIYFVLKRRVATPLIRMTGIVTRLARQDYEVEVPVDHRRDEIGEMTAAIEVFRANGLERERLDAELRRDQKIKDLILQMMHRLQACQTQGEVSDVVALFMPQIFPDLAGNLHITGDSRLVLTLEGSWLSPVNVQQQFSTSDCWGLRRGRPHCSDPADRDVICQHLEHKELPALCVPLTALGDTVGLLHLEARQENDVALENARLYLELIAENLGLAIANLQLRDRLAGLAVRDPLTGLLNRRSLDEAINTEARSQPEHPLTCVMIDIDHFKHFNDDFGHDAGDAVIRHVAQILVALTGEKGNVFRFGGEEFTILLRDTTEHQGAALAELLRTSVMASPLSDRGRILGTVTISAGVASSPDNGPATTVLNRADTALLAAKAAGRNRVITSSTMAMQPELG